MAEERLGQILSAESGNGNFMLLRQQGLSFAVSADIVKVNKITPVAPEKLPADFGFQLLQLFIVVNYLSVH